MKRPDADIVRSALKGGHLVMGDKVGLETPIKLGLGHPLISLADKPFGGTKVMEFARSEFDDNTDPLEGAELVFHEYVLHYREFIQMTHTEFNGKIFDAEVWTSFTEWDHPHLLKLKNYPQDERQIRESIANSAVKRKGAKLKDVIGENIGSGLNQNPDEQYPVHFMTVLVRYRGEPKTYVWHGFGTQQDNGGDFCVMPTEGTEEFWGQRIMGLNEHALTSIFNSIWIWYYAKYGDKHVVEVTPTPDKLAKAKRNPVNRKRPWATATGPHVLFLDRMPSRRGESTGTHASPKPHRRRGHWKTLSHPRFRHHPQYQKKIYVKPSFVGDKQVTYEGNIYRLVEPLEGEA